MPPPLCTMGDKSQSTECETEERTEPVSYSASEYTARLRGLYGRERYSTAEINSDVHLDELIVPPDKDIRLLVRPLVSRSVSPGSRESCEWVALRAEVSATDKPEETVLAVTQTPKDIKFTVRTPEEFHKDGTPIPPMWFELYYDPQSDNQILLNHSDAPIVLSRVSQSAPANADDCDAPRTPGTPNIAYAINPGNTKALSPGSWRIKIEDIEVLDFRILEKRQPSLQLAFPELPFPALPLLEDPEDRKTTNTTRTKTAAVSEAPNSSAKRSFVADDDAELQRPSRRQKVQEDDGAPDVDDQKGVIMFLRPAAKPLVFPLPTTAKEQEVGVASDGHALLDMKSGETAVLPDGYEMTSYQLTKHDPIASTSLSTVFTGTMEHPDVPAGNVITVKVIKTRPTRPTNRPQETERSVINQADSWQREVWSHEKLRHRGIPTLYSSDARYLALYMQHVDAPDLSKRGIWRSGPTDYFVGDRKDAARILRDVSGALNYLHGESLAHNDIKPANILYSQEQGAYLCDFGLSARADSRNTPGGTPYYVPPEFIGKMQRGQPSDVWALGVTMLYLLRKISFPDSRIHHRVKPLHWMIADINQSAGSSRASNGGPGRPSAVAQMQMWLKEVHEAKETLNTDDKVERLVREMLTPNPRHRITMERLVWELGREP